MAKAAYDRLHRKQNEQILKNARQTKKVGAVSGCNKSGDCEWGTFIACRAEIKPSARRSIMKDLSSPIPRGAYPARRSSSVGEINFCPWHAFETCRMDKGTC
jgi:hypothetical protein